MPIFFRMELRKNTKELTDMTSIKCPCCGGLTTNYLNCDYCGSYLVRFSKRNLEYDDTQLGKDATIILGIQEELQANIDEQINTHAQNHIISKTKIGNYEIEVRNPRSIGDFVKRDFGDIIHSVNPTNPFDENEIAIILVIRVYEFSKSAATSDKEIMWQLKEKQKKDWLEHVGLLGLCAVCEDPLSSIYGNKGVCHSYYINFGQDVTGAARALSSLILGVNHVNIEEVHFNRSSKSEIQYQASIRAMEDDKKHEFKNMIIGLFCSYIFIQIFECWRLGLKHELFLWITIANTIFHFILLVYFLIKRILNKS